MSTPTNHWKLGLFVVVGIVLGLTTLIFLGAQSMQKEVIGYKTYFDESVQGLDVGSPVKFRGVSIGTVSAINVARDRRHVEVTSDLTTTVLNELGLAHGHGKDLRLSVPEEVRMQLASQGITGVKFMQLDFFDPKASPPPELPFPAPPNYIPAAVSTLKNLEDAIVRAVDRIPEMADAIMVTMTKVNGILKDVEDKRLPEQAVATLTRTNQVLASLQGALKQADVPKLSSQARDAMANLNTAMTQMNGLLARIGSDKGILASAQRATNAVGDVASNARGLEDEFGETLRGIQDLTAALQRVTDALDRDPDMFLKGRGKAP